jgi:hypothetical protein
MFSRALASITFLVFLSIILTTGAGAQWIKDGNPIIIHSDSQTNSIIVHDGSGGAYIAWLDYRNVGDDIYIQHLDGYGRELWTAGGLLLTSTGNQRWAAMAPDGEGGVLIAWHDDRNGTDDIYAQRLDADGNELWTSGGVAASLAAGHQRNADIASDGSGGAVIVWDSYLSPGTTDIYAQRIDYTGTALWTTNGEPVCTNGSGTQNIASVVVDTISSYVYFCWQDFRTGTGDIYAQRYSLSGSRGWTVDGKVVCSETNHQLSPQIILNRNGNIVICWRDYRNGTGYGVFAQALDVWGAAQWTAGGVSIYSASSGTADDFHICADPLGGVFVTWDDDRNGTDRVRAQKLDPAGSSSWTADGMLVCDMTHQTTYSRITTDGLGGALVVWNDGRYGSDLYMQNIDASGSLLWASTGAVLTEAPRSQHSAAITDDGSGSAIVSWTDYRDSQYDLYAGRMDRSGNWGFPAPEITSVRDVPGDQGGAVSVAWDASYLDSWPGYEITEYSVWRAIDQQAAMMFESNGAMLLTSAGDLDPGLLDSELGADVIRRGMLSSEPYYWQLVSYDEAFAQENYADVIATLFDSTGVCDEYHYFQVIAHTGDRTVFWESFPDSGYSVDNLAPAAPLGLAGEQSYSPEGLQLMWDPNSETDLAGYKIYRGTSESFVPGPGNFVASTPDTASFDDEWTWDTGYWYKVAAVDIHGNESIFAVFGPDMVTGDDPMPLPDATFLAQNFPNPFNPITNIGFGIKESGHISIRIYDAAGRLVTTLVDESKPAGRYTTEWNGQNTDGSSAASGVYFYRLTSKEFEETKKMILLR